MPVCEQGRPGPCPYGPYPYGTYGLLVETDIKQIITQMIIAIVISTKKEDRGQQRV